MSCLKKKKNMEKCNCAYDPCPRKGNCCECVSYHRGGNGLPACLRDDAEDVFTCGNG